MARAVGKIKPVTQDALLVSDIAAVAHSSVYVAPPKVAKRLRLLPITPWTARKGIPEAALTAAVISREGEAGPLVVNDWSHVSFVVRRLDAWALVANAKDESQRAFGSKGSCLALRAFGSHLRRVLQD